MNRDTLFLLAPGFTDGEQRQYCPECAEVWGLLHYFPAIMESLSIRYQEIARPRSALVSLLGESYQNCPTLLLDVNSPDGYMNCGIQRVNGHRFIDNAQDIGRYYAQRFGTPTPR